MNIKKKSVKDREKSGKRKTLKVKTLKYTHQLFLQRNQERGQKMLCLNIMYVTLLGKALIHSFS